MYQSQVDETSSIFGQITLTTNIQGIPFKVLGVDVNNLIGVPIQKMRNICNTLTNFPKNQQKNTLNLIKDEQIKIIQTFLQKIILLVKKGKKLILVFDGVKIMKVKQLKWKMNASYMTPEDFLAYLNGPAVVQQLFSKKVYSIEQSEFFWQIFEEIIMSIILYLKKMQKFGVTIQIAPFQTDGQLVQLFREQQIEAVVSNDRDFINYKVPLITNLEQSGKCQLLELRVEEVKRKRKFDFTRVARVDPIKRAIFSALAGSKHLPKLQSSFKHPIPTTLLTQVIIISQDMEQVFARIINQFLNVEIPPFYFNLAELAMLVTLASPCFNSKSGKVQFLQPCIDHFLKRRGVNKEKLLALLNSNYSKEVRKGDININTNVKRYFNPIILSKCNLPEQL